MNPAWLQLRRGGHVGREAEAWGKKPGDFRRLGSTVIPAITEAVSPLETKHYCVPSTE